MKQRKQKKRDLSGKSFAFFGEFQYWPEYHGESPEELVSTLGGHVVKKVDEKLTYLVLGEFPGTGRSQAKKKLERIQTRALKQADAGKSKGKVAVPQLLTEAEFRDMVRIDVTGRKFAFFGGFDCCPEGDNQLLFNMVTAVNGIVVDQPAGDLDYMVIGARRAAGKAAVEKKVGQLIEAGHEINVIGETAFLELVRNEGKKKSGTLDFASFMGNLLGIVDKKKADKAIKMLRAEKYQLYSKLEDNTLVGIVRSQTSNTSVYAPWVKDDGQYGCCDMELNNCMGMLDGRLCKHLLVLVIGLARSGVLSPEMANEWISKAALTSPERNQELVADTLIQYHAAKSGEIDWRPTETIPEDYYSM